MDEHLCPFCGETMKRQPGGWYECPDCGYEAPS